MVRALYNWFDHRTGIRSFIKLMLLEKIPGGAKWRYVWGSTLSFVFGLQLITGLLLMTTYSPSTPSDAWESVHSIQYEMDFGWLIRGLHHYGSQTMVVLLALHMLQVVIAGAQLPPREINWWLGLGLMGVVLGLGLTGYLLPWDQKGFFATRVATSIAAKMPVIGPHLERFVVGGPDYGHATLTRFYALHVAILPGALIVLMIAHIAVFRRHGVTHPKNPKGDGWFWPDQAFRDLLVCLVIFGVLVVLVFNGHSHPIELTAEQKAEEAEMTGNPEWYTHWSKAGRRGLGANLDSPANPSSGYIARPEWYFLFLFQLLKYFRGGIVQFLIGAAVIPGAVGFLLFLLPLFGYGKLRWLGHILGVVAVVALLTGVVSLTCFAIADDTAQEVTHALLYRIGLFVVPAVAAALLLFLAFIGILPTGGFRAFVSLIATMVMTVLVVCTGLLLYACLSDHVPARVQEFMKDQIAKYEKATEKSTEEFEEAIARAKSFKHLGEENHKQAARAVLLAHRGVPIEGARFLLERDPTTRFPELFVNNCATCHSYGEYSKGAAEWKTRDLERFKDHKLTDFNASDLHGFGKKDWLAAFLWDPGAERFYGRCKDEIGDQPFIRMKRWVERQKRRKNQKELAELKKDFGEIAQWLAGLQQVVTSKEEREHRLILGRTAEERLRPKLFGHAHVLSQVAGAALFSPVGGPLSTMAKLNVASRVAATDWFSPKNPAYKLITEKYDCTSCHSYEQFYKGDGAPDLSKYSSTAWLTKFLHAPGHPKYYGVKNYMPTFRETKTPLFPMEKKVYLDYLKSVRMDEDKKKKVNFADISEIERELIVRYLAGDDRIVYGGRPITGEDRKK